MIIKIIGFTKD